MNKCGHKIWALRAPETSWRRRAECLPRHRRGGVPQALCRARDAAGATRGGSWSFLALRNDLDRTPLLDVRGCGRWALSFDLRFLVVVESVIKPFRPRI